MLAGVAVVQSLLGLGKTVARQIPNPQRAIGHHQHFGRLLLGWIDPTTESFLRADIRPQEAGERKPNV
jgi:hypothetical protein